MIKKSPFFVSGIVLILFLSVISSFFPNISEAFNMRNQYKSPEYVILASEVRHEVANELSKRYNMKVSGIIGGLADRVNLLGLAFDIRRSLPKETLREMIVDCTEYFLSVVNTNEKIRPYLKNYPFTVKEIEVKFFISSVNGENLYEPDISIVSMTLGKISYWSFEKGKIYSGESVVEESYEDALKILRERKKE